MSTRDPRRDPRPGDVVQKGKFQREVYGVQFGKFRMWVWYRTQAGYAYETNLDRWAIWARNATVIHAAPEAEQL